MPDIDPAIAEALGTLSAEDGETARLAGTALTWVTGGGGAGRITQERVQRFVWYDLPIKLRPTPGGQQAITAALARILDLLGMPRYAQICRSEATQRVHSAYAEDPQTGLLAFREANLASGIYPQDLPEFRWAAAMGMEEAKALSGVQDFLELAVASGELEPGTKGWKQKQRKLVRQYLTAPNFQLGGQTPLDVMNTERIQNWIKVEPSETRQRMLSGLANRLLYPVDLPPDISDPYPPLSDLLGVLAEGRPPEPDQGALMDIASGLGLTRTLRGEQVITRKGRSMLERPLFAWRLLPSKLLQGNPYHRLAGEVMLALLINGESRSEEILAAIRKVATEANYREAGTGQPPSDVSITKALEPTVRPLEQVGLLIKGESPPTLKLTSVGKVVGLEAMRSRATGPPAAPWD